MIIFFCNDIQGELAFFSEEETKHCTQVLRKKLGETVQFIDGIGHWYEGEIREVSKRQTVVQIKARHQGTDHTNFRLHMAVAPLKSMERFEWFLEKATEIGVDEITPLMTEHTERGKLRYDRLGKIILSAAKQCLRTRLPILNELIDFEDFIKINETHSEEARFIPHCHVANLSHLKNNCPAASNVTILIGPEGDFSIEEVALAKANGFMEVGLGANRLRTETAAIVACHIVHLINSYFDMRLLLLLSFAFSGFSFEGNAPLKLALLKYNGGGDWYANPTSLTNLAKYCNDQLGTEFDPDYATVEVGSVELYNYPFIHMTGHGNVVFSDAEAENLRNYLMGGGFLHIDDNYGIDPFVRPAMKKVFPELQFIELPYSHPIYHQKFEFKNGLPKVHKHDDKPSQGFGLFWEGRLVCFYSYECDLGDGWEDQSVHNDPEEKRLQALKMGANLVQFVFQQ